MTRASSIVFGLLLTGMAGTSMGQELYRVSAEEAFDAYASQTDPNTQEPSRVIIVDVRTRAEYFWVGTPAEVESIVMKCGYEYVPDNGKVVLEKNGKVVFRVNNRKKKLSVSSIASMNVVPIAVSVPFKFWQEEDATMVTNDEFFEDITDLADDVQDTVLIFMCRSGKRSEAAPADPNFPHSLFKAVYEIDVADDNAKGGFEGSDYDKMYAGYRGYPGRPQWFQETPSVSWVDSGLPIIIGAVPEL